MVAELEKFDTDLIRLQEMYDYEERRKLLGKKYQALLDNNNFEDNDLEQKFHWCMKERERKMDNKYTYYFTVGEVDHSMDEYCDDEDNQGIALANSAEWIYMIFSNVPITYDNFEKMIIECKTNIINGDSKVFDYPDDFENYDIEDLIDYEDIIFEMQEKYDLSIGRSRVPLIWGNDCWEDDENYDEDNPPSLWRMILYDYGY